jgi:hypothetical protein
MDRPGYIYVITVIQDSQDLTGKVNKPWDTDLTGRWKL